MKRKHKISLIIVLLVTLLAVLVVLSITKKTQENKQETKKEDRLENKVDSEITTPKTEDKTTSTIKNNDETSNNKLNTSSKNEEPSKFQIEKINQSTVKKVSAKNNIVKLKKEDLVITPFELNGNVMGRKDKNIYFTLGENSVYLYDIISKNKTLIQKPLSENSGIGSIANSKWLIFCETPLSEARCHKNWKLYGKNLDSGEIILIDENTLGQNANLPDIQSYTPYDIVISEDNIVVYNKKYYKKDKQIVSGILSYDLNTKTPSVIYEETDIENKGLGRISVSKNIVVWERVREYDESETLPVKFNYSDIFAYDLNTKKLTQITDDKYCSWPMVYDGNVVYTVFDLKTDVGNQKIFMYNIKENKESEVIGDNILFRHGKFCYLGMIYNSRYMTYITDRDSHFIYDIKEDKFIDLSDLLPKNFGNAFVKVFNDNTVYLAFDDRDNFQRYAETFELKD